METSLRISERCTWSWIDLGSTGVWKCEIVLCLFNRCCGYCSDWFCIHAVCQLTCSLFAEHSSSICNSALFVQFGRSINLSVRRTDSSLTHCVPSCSVSNNLSFCLLYKLQLVAVSSPRNPQLYLLHSPHASDRPDQRVSKQLIQTWCWMENIQNWGTEGGREVLRKNWAKLHSEVLDSRNEILERWITGGCKWLCAVWSEWRGQFGTVEQLLTVPVCNVAELCGFS